MKKRILAIAGLVLAPLGSPAWAAPELIDNETRGGGGAAELPPYLQCVPYARQLTGIQIYGDAHTWWDQAEGRYARGHTPRIGAVMAFRPHGNMRLGHVAAVSRVVDSRTVLLSHANWSEINGRRGQIENNVQAVDVSPANDWSEVKVWYATTGAMGSTAWPVEGFIYTSRPGKMPGAAFAPAPKPTAKPSPSPAAKPVRIAAAESDDPIGDIIRASRRR